MNILSFSGVHPDARWKQVSIKNCWYRSAFDFRRFIQPCSNPVYSFVAFCSKFDKASVRLKGNIQKTDVVVFTVVSSCNGLVKPLKIVYSNNFRASKTVF